MNYFPLGLAEGLAFCNRNAEQKKLHTNIALNRSTIITSPRRYGKSSLVLHVLEKTKLPFVRVDLFLALDEDMVVREILRGINQLINQLVKKPERLMLSVKKILKDLNSKWSLGTDGVHIELYKKDLQLDALAIRDTFLILETLLQERKMQAVFFIDEFQEIGVLANSKGIESVIRAIAEKSTQLTFLFSGSNRHILSQLFDDRKKPLYMLCDKILLNRIEKKHYIPFINKIAKDKWSCFLSEAFFEKLFLLTECHPYYINLVCGRLYSENRRAPTEKDVENTWLHYLLEEKTKIAMELSKLSLIQKKILFLIAEGQYTRLTAKETLQKISTTSAAVIKALKILLDKDYIYETQACTYRIVDPLIRFSLTYFFD